MTNDKIRPRNAELDAYVEEFTLFVMPVRRLNDDSTARNVVEEGVELGSFGLDAGRHGIRWFHIPVGDLNRQFHMGIESHEQRPVSRRPLAKYGRRLSMGGSRSAAYRIPDGATSGLRDGKRMPCFGNWREAAVGQKMQACQR